MPVTKFKREGYGIGTPGIAVNVHNNTVILAGRDDILSFKPDGSLNHKFRKTKTYGLLFVASDKEHIYVTVNHVQVYDHSGVPLFKFEDGEPSVGRLRHPEGILVDSFGHIMVANRGNGSVDMFTSQGDFVRTVDKTTSPMGIAIGPHGHLVVTNIFDDTIPCHQQLVGQLETPTGRKHYSCRIVSWPCELRHFGVSFAQWMQILFIPERQAMINRAALESVQNCMEQTIMTMSLQSQIQVINGLWRHVQTSMEQNLATRSPAVRLTMEAPKVLPNLYGGNRHRQLNAPTTRQQYRATVGNILHPKTATWGLETHSNIYGAESSHEEPSSASYDGGTEVCAESVRGGPTQTDECTDNSSIVPNDSGAYPTPQDISTNNTCAEDICGLSGRCKKASTRQRVFLTSLIFIAAASFCWLSTAIIMHRTENKEDTLTDTSLVQKTTTAEETSTETTDTEAPTDQFPHTTKLSGFGSSKTEKQIFSTKKESYNGYVYVDSDKIVFGQRQFSKPFGVAVSADNEIFVTDAENCRVQVHRIDGEFLRSFQTAVNGLEVTCSMTFFSPENSSTSGTFIQVPTKVAMLKKVISAKGLETHSNIYGAETSHEEPSSASYDGGTEVCAESVRGGPTQTDECTDNSSIVPNDSGAYLTPQDISTKPLPCYDSEENEVQSPVTADCPDDDTDSHVYHYIDKDDVRINNLQHTRNKHGGQSATTATNSTGLTESFTGDIVGLCANPTYGDIQQPTREALRDDNYVRMEGYKSFKYKDFCNPGASGQKPRSFIDQASNVIKRRCRPQQ
uniref:Uncharacterized protein n=1 Tax=Branchiostoma floridae TaxID=7739 RepID=C3Y6Z6_BRAFL|eukprot:XP_002608096.1 hypothetical protein BRAFLDRAFT_91426 [Branchiostoma floridae]